MELRINDDDISLSISGGKLRLKSPYDVDTVDWNKNNGGKWDSKSKTWEFLQSDDIALRRHLWVHYGWTDEVGDRYTLVVSPSPASSFPHTIGLGSTHVSAFRGASLGWCVEIISGSCSRRQSAESLQLRLRHVHARMVAEIEKDAKWIIHSKTIEQDVDIDALRAEHLKLSIRLQEIDILLAQIMMAATGHPRLFSHEQIQELIPRVKKDLKAKNRHVIFPASFNAEAFNEGVSRILKGENIPKDDDSWVTALSDDYWDQIRKV